MLIEHAQRLAVRVGRLVGADWQPNSPPGSGRSQPGCSGQQAGGGGGGGGGVGREGEGGREGKGRRREMRR